MQKRTLARFNWFIASITVIVLGSGFPVWAVQAARAASLCPDVHSAAKPRASSGASLPAWTQLKAQSEKVQHIVRTFSKGIQSFQESRSFAQKIQQLPEAHQQQWLKALAQSYHQVPKKNPDPTAAWHIGGRRALDHILVLLENYPRLFEKEILGQGLSAKQAYQNFLSRQAEMFSSQYDYKAIEIVISTLRRELQNLEGSRHGPPVKILISGSFPNGKADLINSDIDLSLSDGGLMRETYNWQAKVDQALREAGIESSLQLAYSSEGADFYGKINPIVVQVATNDVQLLVFPAPLPGQGFIELYSGRPQIYLLQN